MPSRSTTRGAQKWLSVKTAFAFFKCASQEFPVSIPDRCRGTACRPLHVLNGSRASPASSPTGRRWLNNWRACCRSQGGFQSWSRQHKNPVQMVGHNLEGIYDERSEPLWQCIPDFLSKAARLVQYHLALDDFTEQGFLGLGANGDEIRSTSRVIISAQTNGASMMQARIVSHISIPDRCRGTACRPLFGWCPPACRLAVVREKGRASPTPTSSPGLL